MSKTATPKIAASFFVCIVLSLLCALIAPAHAGNFSVTSTADPGDGTCDVAGTGDECTLREAIAAANSNAMKVPSPSTCPATGRTSLRC